MYDFRYFSIFLHLHVHENLGSNHILEFLQELPTFRWTKSLTEVSSVDQVWFEVFNGLCMSFLARIEL